MITNILRILLTRSFKPLIFVDKPNYELILDTDETGIYIHIPFCEDLCPFCPYYKIKYKENLIEPYKEALINEINMVGRSDRITKNITSVYFGGGTPALMLKELPEIITALEKNFNISNNIGIELHPRDITKQSLKELRSIGFDKVSIGVQSFQTKSLNTLGRQYVDGAEKVRLSKEVWFSTIDVDLIFGIKGQSEDDIRSDFLTAVECGATQVSTYPFIDFSYANNKSKPMGKQEKKKLLESIEKVRSETGWERTAVWTFAERKTPRYSSITRDTFIGFGPSAASLTQDLFKVNTFSVGEYIRCVNNGSIPTALNLKFNKRTRALYWLFWNVYILKLDNIEFKKMFGVDLEDMFNIELKIAQRLGLIIREKNGYKVTEKGTYLYHLIEQRYTNQYIDKLWRIAGTHPWPSQIKLN